MKNNYNLISFSISIILLYQNNKLNNLYIYIYILYIYKVKLQEILY